jgi:hypothetical protein
MNPAKKTVAVRSYFPAIVCVECDSPIDALVALCIPRDEAMNLVAASWRGGESTCVLATVDGGRSVAALRTPQGRWAACNAFLDKRFKSKREAERELGKLLKRGRRGYVGMLAEHGPTQTVT